MINALICGANGMMGQVLAQAIEKTDGIQVCCGVDLFPEARKNDFPVYKNIDECKTKTDVIIDFSRPEALRPNLEFAVKSSIPIVIATTGFTDEAKTEIVEAAKNIPVFFAANMSLGVNLQMELAKKAAEFLGEAYDIEIIEKHHNQKVDSPSGTALSIAEHINSAYVNKKDFVYGRHTKTDKRGREIGIHGVRGGTIVGDHSVLFAGTDEVVEINHSAQSKQVFAFGAVRAAKFIVARQAGLYNMKDMIMQKPVTNIFETDNQAMITLTELEYTPAVLSELFTDIAGKGIAIDMISQTAPINGRITLSFTMNETDLTRCVALVQRFGVKAVSTEGLTKLTIEGSGMEKQPGVASVLFKALAKEDISIYIISTSETLIGFCVNSEYADAAFAVVSEAFSL